LLILITFYDVFLYGPRSRIVLDGWVLNFFGTGKT